MGSIGDLKSYLLSSFNNQKYKNISLVELYAFDYKYYRTLEKRNKIDDDAKAFFQKMGGEILDAGIIPTEAFWKLKYETIIDEYLKDSQRKPEPSTITNKRQNAPSKQVLKEPLSKPKEKHAPPNSDDTIKSISPVSKKSGQEKPVPRIHCIQDFSVLRRIGASRATIKKTGESVEFPMYQCTACKRLYTSLHGFADEMAARLDGVEYINKDVKCDATRYNQYLERANIIAPGSRCYVHAV